MRRKIVAGNWRMHGSTSQASALLAGIQIATNDYADVAVIVFPPFPYLSHVHSLLKNTAIQLGAQNLYVGAQGAFTGEVSASMLKDVGCQFVLIGHSERRVIFKEPLDLIAQKCLSAIEAGLTPILCVGETLKEREEMQTENVIREQIESVIKALGIGVFQKMIIAYEPVWAIGTGKTATPAQAEAVHHFIRDLIAQNNVDLAKTICILYGGSVKPENASELFGMPNIDGGLIGGASLDANLFSKIIAAASLLTDQAKIAERR